MAAASGGTGNARAGSSPTAVAWDTSVGPILAQARFRSDSGAQAQIRARTSTGVASCFMALSNEPLTKSGKGGSAPGPMAAMLLGIVGIALPAMARVSWTVSILPFIGENDLADWYREYTSGVGVDDVTNENETEQGGKRVDLFVCPSADGMTRSGLCYMGNGGTGAETLASGSPPQQYRGDGAMLDTVGNGYAAGRWSLDQMALGDGMAGTLLLVERCGLDAPRDVSWASFPMPTSSGNRNRFETNHVVLHPPALAGNQHPPVDSRILNPTAETLPAASNDWAWRYPSSRHKGGVVASFADGHVRFLGEKIAPWVYCQLLTSDKTYRSARAAGWEQYFLNGQWVPYILDDADIQR